MFWFTFDLVNLINIVVGAILGGLISVVVSYYFFLRGKGLETLTHWLSYNVSNAIIQQQYPQFFGALAVHGHPNQPATKHPDIPRLEVVIFSPPQASVGGVLEVLCRVVDEGWNFPSSSGGLVIIDHTGRKYAVSGVGFGYMLAKIPINGSENSGKYQLTFEMQDIDKRTNLPLNHFSQTVDFEVV